MELVTGLTFDGSEDQNPHRFSDEIFDLIIMNDIWNDEKRLELCF